jgi:hypothetical protein
MNYPRIPGHQLSNAEILEFWQDTGGPGGEYILDTACQVAPGVAVNGGYWSGQQVLRLSNGEVFGSVPDDSVPDDFGRLTYWGKDLDDERLGDLLVDFIGDNHLEVFIAFALNFREERFAENADQLEICHRKFWCQWNGVDREQRERVAEKLSRRSEPYRILVGFFDAPFRPEFSGILDRAVNEQQFATVYLHAKK